MLNADNLDALREAINCAYVEVLDKIDKRGSSTAATAEPLTLAAAEPACDLIAEP